MRSAAIGTRVLTGSSSAKKGCVKAVNEADSPKLAKLVKLAGVLLETKAYLFWSKPQTC